jgi:hypothetical protein
MAESTTVNLNIADTKVIADTLRDAKRRIESLQYLLALRERELLAIKGPCSYSYCRLHAEHSGPCDVKLKTGKQHAD